MQSHVYTLLLYTKLNKCDVLLQSAVHHIQYFSAAIQQTPFNTIKNNKA